MMRRLLFNRQAWLQMLLRRSVAGFPPLPFDEDISFRKVFLEGQYVLSGEEPAMLTLLITLGANRLSVDC